MQSSSVTTETVLLNGAILADPTDCRVLPHEKTVIVGDKLEHVNVPNDSQTIEARTIDCSGCLIMPGLVNAHTHAAMSLLRGVADDLPLEQWLNDYIFPAEGKYVSTDFVYLGTLLSAMEMALAGITTFADGYFHMESAATAATEIGLRSIVAQGILDVPAPDAPTPGSWLARVQTFLADCPRNSLVTPALFCHSTYLCGPDTIRQASEMAQENGLLLFSHVGETLWEVSEVRSRYGLHPVELLKRENALCKDFVAVHATHVGGEEIRVLAESGAGAVHCPESNMKLASGAAPIVQLLNSGIPTGMGTDGPASNNNLDLLEELRTASYAAKLTSMDPIALNAKELVAMATMGGARVLGLEDKIGSLQAGKLADVIIVDMDAPHLTPVYDPVSHLVYSAKGSDVRDVIVNGRLVVRNRGINTVDEGTVKKDVRNFAGRIAADLGLGTEYGARMFNER
jgi:5-methylthioadenosine/S-adenosylhomocysteine deaminase